MFNTKFWERVSIYLHMHCFSSYQRKNVEYLYFIFIFYSESPWDVKFREIMTVLYLWKIIFVPFEDSIYMLTPHLSTQPEILQKTKMTYSVFSGIQLLALKLPWNAPAFCPIFTWRVELSAYEMHHNVSLRLAISGGRALNKWFQ